MPHQKHSTASLLFDPTGCPITLTLQLVSRRWVLFILRAVSHEIHTFNAIQRALGGRVSSRLLSDRLRELVAAGILEKRALHHGSPKSEYHFTRRSQTLRGLIEKLCDWAARFEKP